MRWIFLFWFWATSAIAEPVVVFAAASLKEPLDRLAQGRNVVISYGGSGTLARQVAAGAPADLVLLANTAWAEELDGLGIFLELGDFASNSLVVVGPHDSGDLQLVADALTERLQTGPLAMGFVKSVPAGIYGKAALEEIGLWSAVKDKVAEVDNVRAALALVVRGEAPLGIVYVTDAQASDKVRIVAPIPPDAHPEIRYQGGPITEAGAAFWAVVKRQEGQSVFAQAGFLGPVE